MSVKHIDNINDYVINLIENGADVISGKKTAVVQARQGHVGEVITTDIDKTKNTVTLDDKTDKPGWIVTNPDGEEYIVRDSKFSEIYEPAEKPGEYSKKAIQLLVPCNETVEFTPTWGGSFTVEAGGYFTINGYNDIAGIQKDAFAQTYKVVSQSEKDVDKALSILLNEPQREVKIPAKTENATLNPTLLSGLDAAMNKAQSNDYQCD